MWPPLRGWKGYSIKVGKTFQNINSSFVTSKISNYDKLSTMAGKERSSLSKEVGTHLTSQIKWGMGEQEQSERVDHRAVSNEHLSVRTDCSVIH